tara:strand:- start:863 stop:1084 length:222 start_codon:yes stop_codon:yes gene_type:complete
VAKLYNLKTDRGEKQNLAAKHPALVAKLITACIAWHRSLPPDNRPKLIGPFRRKQVANDWLNSYHYIGTLCTW